MRFLALDMWGLWNALCLAFMVTNFATGCRDKTADVERRCMPDDDLMQQRADFVLQCANNANPRSDEEPEDMLRECDRIAGTTFCEWTWAAREWNRSHWTPCAHADRPTQAACRRAGW